MLIWNRNRVEADVGVQASRFTMEMTTLYSGEGPGIGIALS